MRVPASVVWDWLFRCAVVVSVFTSGWMVRVEIRAQAQDARLTAIEKLSDERTIIFTNIGIQLSAIREALARLEERSLKK